LAAVGVSSLAYWSVPGAAPWRVGVRSPGAGRGEALGVLTLREGGLATSSMEEQPGHVRDPKTGGPAAGGLEQATAVAAGALEAEAWSTALLVGGAALAASPGAPPSVLVTDSAVLVSPSLRAAFEPGVADRRSTARLL
jgi:thiamine biosynthesis lipoprotein